jgi:hypothetical protein
VVEQRFGQFFSQTHLVTLPMSKESDFQRFKSDAERR